MEHFPACLLILFSLLPMILCGCVPGENCKLPDCLCFQKTPPGGLDYKKIPQIVIFTFDDAVRTAEIKFYNRLFSSDRLNPNGCPITMTLFVQDDNTEYGVVRSLYQRGMEIAVHSISHKSPQSDWKNMPMKDLKQEIYGQKMNIHKKAGVPLNKIRGWRSPYLQPTGNTQYAILADKQYGFWYDSTLGMKKRSLGDKGVWPFTLDHGYPMSCESPPCPTGRYPRLWEFLITEMIDNEFFPRTYVDSYRPENVSKSYDYLMQNFRSYYKGSRAPFMINMHAAWFFYEHNLIAMDKFIKFLLTYDDVYILTIQQALDWVKSPVDLSSVMDFKPWGCDPMALTPTADAPTTAFVPEWSLPPTSPSSGCMQGSTCRLPNCRCSDGGNPGGLSKNVLPQMVLFTFDGAVTALNYKFYERLFPRWRKNPNALPISMTLFLSDEDTDYNLVKQLNDNGMEIAVHNSMQSSTSEFWKTATAEQIQQGIVSQKNKINQLGGVPLRDIQGWRSPYLQPSGDNLFDVLRQNGFIYDSTLCTHKTSGGSGWPFTLDFGWNMECPLHPCPAKHYPGLWVVPVVNLIGHKSNRQCYYVDSCLPGSKSATLKYLWRNFESYYRGNRAPLLLNFHNSWSQANPFLVEALDDFIRDLNDLNDVYIVNVQEALRWLRRPIKLTAMRAFSSWFHEAQSSMETGTDSNYNDNNNINGTGKSDSTADGSEEEGKPDWIILVSIAVAAIFCSCIVITAGMYIVRKHQIKKRANNMREAMTVTSERNSVTDWLNTFPRRLSQLSCSNIDTISSQDRITDNVNFNTETSTITSTDQPVKQLIIHSDSLTLNPKLLESNYSRDREIWNKQERKIPHILNKSQTKKTDKKVSGLPLEAIERNVRKKREAGERKPWSFVWDPCKSQSHSESVQKPKSKTNSRSQNSLGTSSSNRRDSKCSIHTEQVELSPVGQRRARKSDCYDFDNSESYSETIYSGADKSTSQSSKCKSSKVKDVKKRNDKHLLDSIAQHSSTLPSHCETRKMPKDVKSKPRRTASSLEGFHHPRTSTKHSQSFDEAIGGDNLKKPKGRKKPSSQHSSGTKTTSSHRASDDDIRDPRITREMEIEWERDLRKQLDKFLKSKHALKGLVNYR